LVILLLFIPPFLSDIFSTEVIPEGHYFGLGHPNALRVSGFIGIILFLAVFGMWWMYSQWGRKHLAESITVGFILLLGISYWNWHWYFHQAEIYPTFYSYNYTYNHGKALKTVKYLNSTNAQRISVTKDLAEDGNMTFFLNPAKTMSSFQLTATESGMNIIKNNEISVIDATLQTAPLLRNMANDIMHAGYNTQILTDPSGQPDVIILEKVGILHDH
jgi:hypothetical protein